MSRSSPARYTSIAYCRKQATQWLFPTRRQTSIPELMHACIPGELKPFRRAVCSARLSYAQLVIQATVLAYSLGSRLGSISRARSSLSSSEISSIDDSTPSSLWNVSWVLFTNQNNPVSSG